MDSENNINATLDKLLKRNKSAGFKNPPADYFEHFTDSLQLKNIKKNKKITFRPIKENWLQLGSLAVAAALLLALWVFVFDADINNNTDINFTVEELMALNDFQYYNEDLIYSELALVSEDLSYTDAELDALLELGTISTDEIIELYSTEDLK